VPPCVHYSISEYGMTLGPVLASLCDWGRNHMERKAVNRLAPSLGNPPARSDTAAATR